MSKDQLTSIKTGLIAKFALIEQERIVESIDSRIAQMELESRNGIDEWHRRLIGQLNFTACVHSRAYPTLAAASSAALDIARAWCNQWLVGILQEKQRIESELDRFYNTAVTSLVEGLRPAITAIVEVLGQGTLSGLESGLCQLRPQFSPRVSDSVDIPTLTSSISSQTRTVQYTEQEARLVEEQYQDVEYYQEHHRESRRCRSDHCWTTNHSRTVTRTRQVMKYFPVNKSKQETDYRITAAVIKSVTEGQCRSQLDIIKRNLVDSCVASYGQLHSHVSHVVTDEVARFMNCIREDIDRCDRSAAERSAILLTVTNSLNSLSGVDQRINSVRVLADQQRAYAPALFLHPPPSRLSPKQEMVLTSLKRHSDRMVCPLPAPTRCPWSTLSGLHKLASRTPRVELGWLLRTLQRLEQQSFQITCAGLAKAGKSTLLNALLDIGILPADVLPETARVVRVTDDLSRSRECHMVQRGMEDGKGNCTTHLLATGVSSVRRLLKDWNDVTRHNPMETQEPVEGEGKASDDELVIYANIPWLPPYLRRGNVYLADTPGFNEILLKSTIQKQVDDAVDRSVGIVYVMDSARMFQEDESSLIAHLQPWIKKAATLARVRNISHLPIVFVVNKVDEWRNRVSVNEEAQSRHIEDLFRAFQDRVYAWLYENIREILPDRRDEEIIINTLSGRVVYTAGRSAVFGNQIRRGAISDEDFALALQTVYGREWGDIPTVPATVSNLVDNLLAHSGIMNLKEAIRELLRGPTDGMRKELEQFGVDLVDQIVTLYVGDDMLDSMICDATEAISSLGGGEA